MKRIKRVNIMNRPEDEKREIYQRIHTQWLKGVPVTLEQHRSGFPAVTVDCGEDHILTDILSLEEWWKTLPPEIRHSPG